MTIKTENNIDISNSSIKYNNGKNDLDFLYKEGNLKEEEGDINYSFLQDSPIIQTTIHNYPSFLNYKKESIYSEQD